MKYVPAIIALTMACHSEAAGEEPVPVLLSPDGRFLFQSYSSNEVVAGKPAFGIIERANGKLVSDPGEDLGDPSRPEETILWAPDSRGYALTTRVGTRHLATFLYRWDGEIFRRAKWEGEAPLEEWADQQVAAEMKKLGFSENAQRGATIAGDSLAERWLDPRSLVRSRFEGCYVTEADKEEAVSGSARALVRWDERTSAFVIDHQLPVEEAWPGDAIDHPNFEVTQVNVEGDNPNARKIAVLNRETNETKQFTADGWMNSPAVKIEENGWPQIELISHGPAEFVWRKLYRVDKDAYRCVRIDEMTRQSHQAPEGAPLVQLEPQYSLYLIRTHHPRLGDQETFESFLMEVPSPDKKWKAVATYTPQYLQRFEIADASDSSDPVILYDFDDGLSGLGTECRILWRPDSQGFVICIKDGPRVSQTRLYRRTNKGWSKAEMPELDYDFVKETKAAGLMWRHQFETPLWWNGDGELVLELRGFFSGGDESTDYLAHSVLRWDANGAPIDSVSTKQIGEGSE